jgi:hypothetical protein
MSTGWNDIKFRKMEIESCFVVFLSMEGESRRVDSWTLTMIIIYEDEMNIAWDVQRIFLGRCFFILFKNWFRKKLKVSSSKFHQKVSKTKFWKLRKKIQLNFWQNTFQISYHKIWLNCGGINKHLSAHTSHILLIAIPCQTPRRKKWEKFCNSWNKNKRNKLLLITHLHPFIIQTTVQERKKWMLNNLIVEKSWKFANANIPSVRRNITVNYKFIINFCI